MFKCSSIEQKIARQNGMSPMKFALEKKAGTRKYERMMENAWDAVERDGQITDYNVKPWYVENETEREQREFKERNREAARKHRGTVCPECGSDLIQRSGPYGLFIGCTNFPDCRYSRKRW